MTMTSFSLNRFIVLTLLAFFILPKASLMAQDRLFTPLSEGEKTLTDEQQRKHRTFEQQRRSVHIELVRIGDLLPALRKGVLPINLPGKSVDLIAEATRVKYYSSDYYIWNGKLLSGKGRVALVNNQGKITGIIQLEDQWYKIEPLGGGLHAVITLDKTPVSFEGDTPPDDGKERNNAFQPGAQKTSSSSKTLEVLVLYTDDADDAVGDIAGTAALAVNETETAYRNSAVTSSQLNIDHVGIVNVNFQEGTSIAIDVDNLASDSQANSLRDTYWADAVVLLTDGNYGNALGRVKEIGPNNSDAYAIVQADHATTNYTFGHEVGHLQGARHQQCNLANPNCDDTAGSMHGYIWNDGGTDRNTIMYAVNSGATIQHFSNPSIDFNNIATGTSNNNVAQKLRNTASTMADFQLGDRLSAVLLGTTDWACSGDPLSFNSSVSGGTGSYSYRWDTSYNGISYSYAGSGTSYSTNMPPSLDLYVKLTVTSGGQEKIDFNYTENIDGSPYCGSPKTRPSETTLAEQGQLPETFVLNGAYPNPFNPSTVIAYGLPEGADVELVVYDVLGREVARLVDGYREAGYHSVVFEASHLSSGVYLYRLQAGSFVASKPITFLK